MKFYLLHFNLVCLQTNADRSHHIRTERLPARHDVISASWRAGVAVVVAY